MPITNSEIITATTAPQRPNNLIINKHKTIFNMAEKTIILFFAFILSFVIMNAAAGDDTYLTNTATLKNFKMVIDDLKLSLKKNSIIKSLKIKIKKAINIPINKLKKFRPI